MTEVVIDDKEKINRYEQQLEQYRQEIHNLNSVLDSLNANIYWKDINGVYLGCNTAVTKAASKDSKQDIIGKTDNDGGFPWSTAVQKALKNDEEVISSDKIITSEESYNDKVIYLATKSPLKNNKGEIIGIVGVSIDITDRKKLEQDVQEKNKQLESKDQLKKDFIKNFSHDVRLPINGIVGNTQLLQILAKDNAALKQSAIKVDDGVMSLTKMFGHLYSVMMNDELNDEIHNKDFNFTDMVDLEIALVKSSITLSQDIKVSVELDDKIPKELYGDNFKVSQILRNILSNSVKYTEKGTIKLIAKVLEDTKDTIKIKFTIADTGSGITPTDKNKVYEYGRRFVTSYETNIPGTGIGLSIAKKHVDRLGGSIDFDSEPGQGTEFFVELTFGKVSN